MRIPLRSLQLAASCTILLSATHVTHSAEFKSGLQVGQATQAFTVTDVTGPSKGESLCYR